ncbi:bleomycin resistance protein [Fretibacterium fastidiosum]|uniref:bleomycin resistance protein n=1 Tax=Fretibacterium fastidiosum TaxID=651822 RepID=UPI001AD7EABD|nr:VOC family protein [Fretibacterium fastidiosum]
MKFNSLIPELVVSDIERTKDFYVNILNFVIEYERSEDKFIFLSLEDNQMMFEQDNGYWSVGELEYPYGRGVNFEMTVSDVEGLYKRILGFQIKPFRQMSISHYRNGDEDIVQKEFLVQDPDGYLLRFTELINPSLRDPHQDGLPRGAAKTKVEYACSGCWGLSE